MPVSDTKILVKVGKSSKIKFRSAMAFRAITIDELSKLHELHPDASIAIIENIKQSDYERAKQFIESFQGSNESNKVYFFIKSDDDTTLGLADELDGEVVFDINGIYSAIKRDFHKDVDISLDISRKISEEFASDDPFDNSFGDALESAQDQQEKYTVNDQLPTIESKDDLDGFDMSVVDDYEKETESKEEDINSEVKATIETADVPDTVDIKSTEVYKEQVVQLNKAKDEAEKFKREVDDLKEQLRNQVGKVSSLSTLVRALEDERDTFKDRLSIYDNTLILEDPISLVDYQKLEEKIALLSSQTSQSEANSATIMELREQIKALEESKAEDNENLVTYQNRLRESGSRLVSIQGKLEAKTKEAEEFKAKVEQLTLELDTKGVSSEEVDALTSELQQTKSSLDRLNSEIAASKQSVQRLKDSLSEQINKNTITEQQLELEVAAKIELSKLLSSAVSEIIRITNLNASSSSIIDSLKDTISTLEDTNKSLMSSVADYEQRIAAYSSADSTITQLENERDNLRRLNSQQKEAMAKLNDTINSDKSKISDMERQLADADKRVELAHNFSKQETEQAKREAIDWKTRHDALKQQLAAKEAQYNELVKSCGVNEDGVGSLLENSRAIEEINTTLRQQVVSLKNQLDKAVTERDSAQKTATALEESNKSMRANMKSMTELLGGGVAKTPTFRTIKYTGRGMIIPVFGSGGCGVTTTAISMAKKFATQARVLYIDFDIVSPKADELFNKNPVIKDIPGVEGRKSTGLGILVEKQFQFFISNIDSILIRAEQTKSGCVDYLSGLYVRPDNTKLMQTDFSALLNYCGNMYTYIIIDFGRLGNSETNDKLIKLFADVAYKNVVVTTSNKFDAPKFRMKLRENNISVSNVAWLVNMCTSTKLDENCKKALPQSQYSMMPFIPDIYGKNFKFSDVALTKDKLALFMELLKNHR